MLENLIKLSKSLFEMDLVDESSTIDDMIQKLYGNGGLKGLQISSKTSSHDMESYGSIDSDAEDYLDFGWSASGLDEDGIRKLAENIIEYVDNNDDTEALVRQLLEHLE
tara:strand:+ start:6194 stop:6520 length:327 start_codon:yes stop_codon:yes gene_type:complete